MLDIRKNIYFLKSANVKAVACAIVLALAALCVAGCSDKKVKDTTTVIEGDDIREYAFEGDDDSIGGLNRSLGIPKSASISLPAEGCDGIESISIKTDNISVPETDKMYTKRFSMGKLSAEDKHSILTKTFDMEEGVFEYPFDDKEEVSREQIDALFENTSDEVDYSKDWFIGKIGGVEYILYFYDIDVYTDEGFAIKRVFGENVPEEKADMGVCKVAYTNGYPSEYISIKSRSLNKDENEEGNHDNYMGDEIKQEELSVDDATSIAMDMLGKWNITDVSVTTISELYRMYMDYDNTALEYEKGGYVISFEPTVSGVSVYQPKVFKIDTISHGKLAEKSEEYTALDFYYNEITTYKISLTGKGLYDFDCTWPVFSSEEITSAGDLICWNEAVESLTNALPEHFRDYEGYDKVEFNDVRLTYFRTKVGDSEYEYIPVYVFAQVDYDEIEQTYNYDWPIQLIMIDARDGREVRVIQDESRLNAKK